MTVRTHEEILCISWNIYTMCIFRGIEEVLKSEAEKR